jgi:hypothetical protein
MAASFDATLEQARAAKKRAEEVFSALATVVGVGVTRKNNGYAVKINLGAAAPAGTKLPENVDGVPVVVEVVGRLTKQ